MTALEAALRYPGRGWSVLPCRDKVPLVRGGVHAATRDLRTIERWWHTWPQANVAIACGAPSGIVVVDIDAPSQVPELLDLQTLTASTPSGGRHLYFRYAQGIRNRVFDWGELRSDGLYVVAPPASGREWISNSVIADVPEHLARIVFNDQTVTSLPPMEWADAIADHNKTVARWSREESFALIAYRNATSRVLNAKHRMIALNAETYALGRLVGRGWIARSDVVRGMEAASRHNGLIAKRGLEVVRAVILGALAKGAARPYPDLTSREVTVGVAAMTLPQNSRLGPWTPLTACESRSIEQTIADRLRMGQEQPHPDLALAPPRPTAKPGARANSILRKLAADSSQIEWAAQVFGEMIFEGALRPAVAIELLKSYRGFDAGLARGFANAFRHWRRYER
jgi:hypothetical protein